MTSPAFALCVASAGTNQKADNTALSPVASTPGHQPPYQAATMIAPKNVMYGSSNAIHCDSTPRTSAAAAVATTARRRLARRIAVMYGPDYSKAIPSASNVALPGTPPPSRRIGNAQRTPGSMTVG